ncbi:MAG: methyl-accepting chemotaxis protein [Pseudomonadota bacterium]
MITNIVDLRRRGVVVVAGGGWLVVFALIVLAIAGANANAAVALIFSAALNLIPTWCAVKGRTDRTARMAIGVMAAFQPALIVFAMEGSLWQIDFHLYFFVALAALTLLWDIRPILLACGLIAAHHALLSAVSPAWVFWGGGGVVRVLIHAAATVMIGLLLCWITLCLANLTRNIEQSRRETEQKAQELAQTSASLKNALAKVEIEKQKSAQAKAAVNTIREEEHRRITAQFESSISDVTHAVAATATMLERSAGELKAIASETGQEAREVAQSAESASKAAGTVARGVAEMSASIANIAVNASQQSNLTVQATEQTNGGGKAIGSLSGQSQTIGEATRAIVRIAERTDLLSLNAAIEAASAGEAGRGFTIVAHEVKALAGQAAEAATQIDTFLQGVRDGTLEAEHSFAEIETAILELSKSALSISHDVESQRQSADTIEEYARNAAGEVNRMAGRTKLLSERATAARNLSDELENAAAALAENVRSLERSTDGFISNLKVA